MLYVCSFIWLQLSYFIIYLYNIHTKECTREPLMLMNDYKLLHAELPVAFFFSLLITVILIYEALSHIWATKMQQNIKDKKNKIMDLWWSLCTYVYLFLSYSHIFIFLLQTFLCNIIHVSTLDFLVHKMFLQIFVVCFLLFMNFIRKNILFQGLAMFSLVYHSFWDILCKKYYLY